eukprot:CAMPEP_0170540774 /NCGR_PEP_ID=MMETSP0211-20121228/711_1 /TAXON_ID=311385 /ORGANISM="Pseudokeronopsis sp., Strain OXSARD2" /LENGTH=72 /DNA_ID=CAMNT_0010843301 /DNA_START=527 /DNA_END=745 /DNA_ORIENTATION=-
MDQLSWQQIKLLESGGNNLLKPFFDHYHLNNDQQEQRAEGSKISLAQKQVNKYFSKAAEFYRKKLKEAVDSS